GAGRPRRRPPPRRPRPSRAAGTPRTPPPRPPPRPPGRTRRTAAPPAPRQRGRPAPRPGPRPAASSPPSSPPTPRQKTRASPARSPPPCPSRSSARPRPPSMRRPAPAPPSRPPPRASYRPSWPAPRSSERPASRRGGAVVTPAAGPSGVLVHLSGRPPLLVFCVRGFGEPFDRGQPPVPLGGELGHGPGGLVEAAGFDLVEHFPALLAPADQPGPLEHDQMLGDRLAGERHPPGQPAGADLTVADQQVQDPAARRVADGRPQLVIGWHRHPGWRFASNVARRSRYPPQPPPGSPP